MPGKKEISNLLHAGHGIADVKNINEMFTYVYSKVDAVAPLAKTMTKIESFAAYPTASNQYDSSTGNLISLAANFGSPSVVVGGGPNGEDVMRVIVDSGVSGKARVSVGGVAASTTVLNAPSMMVANQGCAAVYYRVNIAGALDTLENVTLQTFAWEGGYGGAFREFNYTIKNTTASQDRAVSGEWLLALMNPASFSAGGISSTPIGAISVGVIASSAQTSRATTVDIGPAFFNIRQRPSFTIGFDNNDSSHHTAFQYMKKLGLKGQLYCDPKEWDKPTILKYAQIEEMSLAGWGVGVHSNGSTKYSPTGWHGVSQQWIMDDLAPDLEILKRYSETAWRHGAWPLGRFDSTAISALKQLGMLSMREIGSNGTGFPLCKGNAFWIYGFGAFASNPSTFTWAQIKTVIDSTIANGAHQEIWCHSLTLSMPLFQKTMNYLAALRDSGVCDIFTAEERYDAHIAFSPI